MYGCHRRAMPTYVETDDHGARRPTGHPGAARPRPLSTPVSVCVPRQVSVCGARARAGLPKGPPPTGHLPAGRTPTRPRRTPASRAAPPTAPTRPANWPPPSSAARSPARLPLLLALPRAPTPAGPRRRRPPGPYNGARAPAQLPSTWTPRAPPTALLLHIPTDLARPTTVRANVPGSESRSGGRPTCAGRPRASRGAMCPGQLATALRHQAAAAATRGSLRPVRVRARPSRSANWRGSMEVEVRGDQPSPVPPASPEKGVWAPLQAPGAAGPVGYLTAYTTRLVTSVVCRGFIPARGDIAIRQPAPGGFSPGAVASLLRCMARRPIRIQLRRAGLHRRVPARILT
ncbi:hypothetical protein NFIA_032130 [Aspergillus fischeri NRRL 181]|uniref:Uncharacterized protein n=1 Tax=Neosartorya fischeri (strain ATCC 1020 / DSM 3700 / CBS 544.65 / FGSC A1164 / JCM 1740 / NRRL 181 / WB 181) TaxID=331117 RepID=A1CUU9_NEOFI|nr:hypothetical protein NFIA_032130 [Aspergillus fischeri NRRL 181]